MLALGKKWYWSLQNICKKSSSLHFPNFKIIELPHSTKTMLKSVSNIFEIGNWREDRCLQIFEVTNTTACPRQAS
jgi:hypothetical protein